MKKLLFIIALFLTTVSYSQKTLDSISIYKPNTKIQVEKLKNERNLIRKLDSLNSIYKTDVFDVRKYYSDGTIEECIIEKQPTLYLKQRI